MILTRIASSAVTGFILTMVLIGGTPALAQSLTCVQVTSSTFSTDCTDSGNFPSTCAKVACPKGTTLTGGGGACAAGDRKLKSLFPRDSGEFDIMCEKQGVPPQVTAICCHINCRGKCGP